MFYEAFYIIHPLHFCIYEKNIIVTNAIHPPYPRSTAEQFERQNSYGSHYMRHSCCLPQQRLTGLIEFPLHLTNESDSLSTVRCVIINSMLNLSAPVQQTKIGVIRTTSNSHKTPRQKGKFPSPKNVSFSNVKTEEAGRR